MAEKDFGQKIRYLKSDLFGIGKDQDAIRWAWGLTAPFLTKIQKGKYGLIASEHGEQDFATAYALGGRRVLEVLTKVLGKDFRSIGFFSAAEPLKPGYMTLGAYRNAIAESIKDVVDFFDGGAAVRTIFECKNRDGICKDFDHETYRVWNEKLYRLYICVRDVFGEGLMEALVRDHPLFFGDSREIQVSWTCCDDLSTIPGKYAGLAKLWGLVRCVFTEVFYQFLGYAVVGKRDAAERFVGLLKILELAIPLGESVQDQGVFLFLTA